jgi:FkbM family methyltransferase
MIVSLSRYRKVIDTYFPSAGRLYRVLRDSWVADKPLETIYGFHLAGDPSMANPDWEAEEISVFLELLGSHDVVIDIGANIGFYSCLAAKRGKHTLAFEPSPRNLHYLNLNLWENRCDDIEVFPVGLGSQSGLQLMYGFGGMASLIEGWAQSDQRHAELVPVHTLDAIIEGRFDRQRIIIKMDVEGFELEVLKGASQTLHRTPKPTWLVEVMLADALFPGGTNLRFEETFQHFWKLGYECRTLDGKFSVVTPDCVSQWIRAGTEKATRNYLFRGTAGACLE